MRRTVIVFFLLLIAPPVAAHIGSPNVIYQGDAGPYPVRVIVKTQGVVPGLAQITIAAADPSIRKVTVRPVHWRTSLEGAPPPDRAEPVRGDPSLYTAELWLMTSGAYSVYVEVEGERGSGTAIVPVQSLATQRLGMPPWMGAVLVVLGGLLVAGLIRLTGAAVESVVRPGVELDEAHRRSSRVAMTLAVLVVGLVLYGGKAWWDSVDADYLAGMYRTHTFTTEVRTQDGRPILELHLDDPAWQRDSPLAPDHGKLMHMFLIREPELDAFAHVHPVKAGDYRFELAVPPLPAGTYRIYADVTHESGFAQTLTDTVELPAGTRSEETEREDVPTPLTGDPDDSWHIASVQEEETRHVFDDGAVMTWERDGPLTTDRETDLRFALHRPEGDPAPLEPYMGMLGHAALRRHDGAVFIHLHPTGTISMAAQQLFAERGAPQETAAGEMDHGMDHSQHGMGGSAVTRVTMPYEFPRPGTYRLWVQVKSAGRVYTGVFDSEVREPG